MHDINPDNDSKDTADPAYLNEARTQELPGILWLVQDPSLKLGKNIQLPAHKLFFKKQKYSLQMQFSCCECWFEEQNNIWRAENFGDKVSEMVFLRDFKSCQACIDEHKTGCLDIHNEEPGDSKDDTQYVGIHGAFTTQERQNLVRDHRLKEESNSMHQFLSKWLASINMNMKERRT